MTISPCPIGDDKEPGRNKITSEFGYSIWCTVSHCWYVILNSLLTTKGAKFTKVREGIAMLFPNFVFFVCFVVKNNERTSTTCVEQ